MTTYALHLTAAQAHTISRACEVLARLGIGQVIEGLRELPQAEGIDWYANLHVFRPPRLASGSGKSNRFVGVRP